jgi:hypothetical protein
MVSKKLADERGCVAHIKIRLDYTGACVFMARRRFAPAPSLVRLKTDPGGCLEVLLSSLPVNYDLFEKMSHA